jgi:hypothetical protein
MPFIEVDTQVSIVMAKVFIDSVFPGHFFSIYSFSGPSFIMDVGQSFLRDCI